MTQPPDDRSLLARTCLTIATYRQDRALEGLLHQIFSQGPAPYAAIIIVDSQGTSQIPELIARQGWQNVQYHNAPANLGSAGNLRRRLQLAAQTGADYAFAINHDGQAPQPMIAELVRCADTVAGLGAAYPLHFYTHRKSYDHTGTASLPLPFLGRKTRDAARLTDVTWSSSNGALYALEPARQGILPDASLWMGWEDMAYGWALARQGWRQVLVNDTVFEDDYEYRPVTLLGRTLYLTDKPAWYAYYQVRNLLLIADQHAAPTRALATVASRILLELGLTTAFRPEKLTRYRYLMAGLLDGLRGRRGRWLVP